MTYLKLVFCTYNDYPPRLVEEIIKNERSLNDNQIRNNHNTETLPSSKEIVNITLNLPYAGDNGDKIISKLKKYVKKDISRGDKEISIGVIYKAKKLGSKFQVKDETKIEHMHNVVYHSKYPTKKCTSHYGGQTKCRIGKRVIQHNKFDKNSHLLQHAKKTRHKRVWLDDFKILGSGYRSNFQRRISESLHIKGYTPC